MCILAKEPTCLLGLLTKESTSCSRGSEASGRGFCTKESTSLLWISLLAEQTSGLLLLLWLTEQAGTGILLLLRLSEEAGATILLLLLLGLAEQT